MEKQKLRMNYGLTERQLVRLVQEARATHGNTGERLLEFLERRLDNVVFRSGLARTIPAARQLIRHRHILVNGEIVDIPSFRVRTQNVVTVHERSKNMACIAASLSTPLAFTTPWLSVENDARVVTVLELPDATSIPFNLSVQRVIEFYSQKV
jgi:small subunit ribosomal protein S4